MADVSTRYLSLQRPPRAKLQPALWSLVFLISVLLGPASAHAQDSVAVDNYRPAELTEDGFSTRRPIAIGHLGFSAQLQLDYANGPVVFGVQGQNGIETRHVVEHQLRAHAAFGLSLFDRFVVFAGLPVDLVMNGDSVAPDGLRANGATLGDVFLGGRIRILGDADDLFALGANLLVTFPTAEASDGSQRLSGDDGVTFQPDVLAELRFGPARIGINLGFRIRREAVLSSLALGHDFTYSLGAGVMLANDQLEVRGELFGVTGLSGFPERFESPLELLVGAKYFMNNGLGMGLAFGPGLTSGIGSPTFRLIASVGYTRRPSDDPSDRDGDGIADSDDACPDEPETRNGYQDDDGCPDEAPVAEARDTDGDGVLDTDDACPNVPGPERNRGCPEQDVPDSVRRVFFLTGSTELTPTAINVLSEILMILRQNPDISHMLIEGHADSRGPDGVNEQLSAQRAEAVRRWLVSQGVDPGRLEARGRSERDLEIQNAQTAEQHAHNRRVEFHFYGGSRIIVERNAPTSETIDRK